jgi:hypothetical protein
MGRLFDLAKAAAGAVSLHTPMGRWMSETSKAVDDQSDGPDYIQTWRISGNQNGVGTNTDLVLETTIAARGVPFNAVLGRYTLSAGKRYHLVAHGAFGSYTDANDRIQVSWVTVTIPAVNLGAPGVFAPLSSGAQANQSPVVEAIFVPTVDVDVAVRVISAAGTVVLAPQDFTASIVEIK